MRRFVSLSGWSLLLAAVLANGQDQAPVHIQTSKPLSPIEQQQGFKLPDGFEVQLFAAEPDILKPLNMAFDDRGRLWLTETTEYPYPAPLDKPGRDHIKILEDTDGDGRADRITTFADGLNIPVGIFPGTDGVIAFSIPYIWKFIDRDGDDVADQRIKLFGPMGWDQDTHGLNNSFRRGFDGWLYACHGFRNETTVQGRDGHSITMHSGNTYRFRLDGSRIEQYTYGQVNPFGMTQDRWGTFFTADCHTKPIYQLLRGGYYPSFGKAHDGLGFVPPMMQHTHDSTAIAGIALYTADHFPPPYQNNFFTGNVVTGRVNRNSLVVNGSTIKAKQEPDFLVSADPWFRPVDIQVGPDGALYVADFYNRIIGHYEVALDHPGRDRHRGRIWRIQYIGDDDPEAADKTAPRDLHSASTDQLINVLAEKNVVRRLSAMDRLQARKATATADVLRVMKQSDSESVQVSALWLFHRWGLLTPDQLMRALNDDQPIVRVHALRIAGESDDWSDQLHAVVLNHLKSREARVAQAAAEALGRHPAASNVAPLLRARRTVPASDPIRAHTIRIALRNQLSVVDTREFLADFDGDDLDARNLAEVAVGSQSPVSASLLLWYLQRNKSAVKEVPAPYLSHIARWATGNQTATVAKVVQDQYRDDLDYQFDLYQSIEEGLRQRGGNRSVEVRQWGRTLALRMLDSVESDQWTWSHSPFTGSSSNGNPWTLVKRQSDGRNVTLLTSVGTGTDQTGIIRSPDFPIPDKLSFLLAGQTTRPNRNDASPVFLRLRHRTTGHVIREARPTGGTTLQSITWDLSDQVRTGERAYLELVDGQERPFGWLAVGQPEPPIVRLPDQDPARLSRRCQSALSIGERLKLDELRQLARRLLLNPAVDIFVRKQAAATWNSYQPSPLRAAIVSLIGEPEIPDTIQSELCMAAAADQSDQFVKGLAAAMRSAAGGSQLALATHLSRDAVGADLLLDLIAAGHGSPRLLQSPTVVARLQATSLDKVDKRIAALTRGLQPVSQQIQQRMDQRLAGLAGADVSLSRGGILFQKHCAICHQLDGQGTVVGPQLDGIGNRGAERLLEDILDPNRNVDAAFQVTTLVTVDGQIRTGLFRRREGVLLVFADSKGQEFKVARDDIQHQTRSSVSLMPENLYENLSESEFYDLLGFLLSKRSE